jgi:hypothetical protein
MEGGTMKGRAGASRSSIAAALLTGTLVTGCGEDSGPAAPDTADVDAYLASLPSWDSYSPPRPDGDAPSGDTSTESEVVQGVTYQCETTPYSITRTPDKIVTMNPDSEILWPGSLLQGRGYAGIGSLAELPIRQRAPLTISIDLLSENNTRTVEAPDLASVTQAIGSLIEAAHNGGHTGGSNVFYTQERMYSVDQGLLKMGLSAKYTGVEVQSSLEVELSAEKTNLTAHFVQRMFTVSVVLPATPGAFFSSALTTARLQEQINLDRLGPDNPPVFVSNVVYGRMLIFSFSSSATESEVRATLNVVLESGSKGAGGELTAEMQSILQQAEIKVVTVGGDAAHALALIRSGNLGDFFQSDAALTTARPISYTVRNLGDNSIAKVSETTEYNLRQCAPEVLDPTGARYRISLDQVTYDDYWGFPCPGVCPLITSYQFWIDDDYGNAITLAEYNPGVGALICERDVWGLDGRPPTEPTVTLHFDGRDDVRLYGSVYSISPFWEWDVSWSGGPLPTGTVNFSDWGPGDCHLGRITGNFTKVEDLYD